MLWLALVVLTILLCLSHYGQCKTPPKRTEITFRLTPRASQRPVVFVHVGPHKTASTHIQTTLLQHQALLSAHGYCIASHVVNKRQAKHMQKMVREFAALPNVTMRVRYNHTHTHRERDANNSTHTNSTAMLEVELLPIGLNDSLAANFSSTSSLHSLLPYTTEQLDFCLLRARQNMIISAENFMTLSAPRLENMFHLLSHVYNAEIRFVSVYREVLRQMYSMYTQQTKVFPQNTISFAEHLLRSADNLASSSIYNTHLIVSTLSRLYNHDERVERPPVNITVIDYYGVQSAGRDIAFSFLSEIIGIHDKTLRDMLRANVSSFENKAPETMIAFEVFQVLSRNARARQRRLCHKGEVLTDPKSPRVSRVASSVVQSLVNESSVVLRSMPVIASNMKIWRKVSIEIDDNVRMSRPGVSIMHGNVTAHREALESFRATILDGNALYKDDRLVRWLDEQVQKQVTAGRFCAEKKGRSKN